MTIFRGKPHWLTSRREATIEVDLDLAAARLMPEALNHVAHQVFDEGPTHDALRDAATAVEVALLTAKGRTVTVSFTAEEAKHMPEALRHVAREVFGRESTEHDLLYEAQKAIREASAPSSALRP